MSKPSQSGQLERRLLQKEAPLDVVVAGYTSIDYIWRVNSRPQPGRTTLLLGPIDPQPRFGGCAPTVALTLALLGKKVALLSWLGDDEHGRAYTEKLAAAGIDTRGIIITHGKPSPRSFLFYDPDGGATCCYHPSGSGQQVVTDTVGELLARTQALALTVGPAALTIELLTARPTNVLLAWSVKADPDAYPPTLRHRLLTEADLICLNHDEVPFLLEVLGQSTGTDTAEANLQRIASAVQGVLVVTAGAAGATIIEPGGRSLVRSEHIPVDDPTGAGDVFFATFLAATLGGEKPAEAARSAADHVVQVLRSRVLEES
jgi:ribokinase